MNIDLENFFQRQDAIHCIGLMQGLTVRYLNANRTTLETPELVKLRSDLKDARYRVYCCDQSVAAACIEKYAPVVRERLKRIERTEITRLNINRLDAEETRDTLPSADPLAVIIGGPVSSRQSQLFRLALKEYFGDKTKKGDTRPFIINKDDFRYEHPLALDVLLNGAKHEHYIRKEVHACVLRMLDSALEGRRDIVIFDDMSRWEDVTAMIRQIRKRGEYRVVVLAAAVNGVHGRVEALEIDERALDLTGVAWKTGAGRHIEAQLFMPYTLKFLENGSTNNSPDLIKVYNGRVRTPFYVNNIAGWATERSKEAEKGVRAVIAEERRRNISLPTYERYSAMAKGVLKRMQDRGSSAEDVADVYMMLEPLLNCRKNPDCEAAKLYAESLSAEIAARVSRDF